MSHYDEILRQKIIATLADDFENLDIIHKEMKGHERDEVEKTLVELINGSYIKSFLYSKTANDLKECLFDHSQIDTYWYGLTEKGIAMLER